MHAAKMLRFFPSFLPPPPPLFGRITVRCSFHLGIVYPLPLSPPPYPLSKHDVLLCPIMKRSVFCLEAGVGMCKAFHASPVASNSAYLSNFCLLVLSNICGTVEAVFMGLLSRDLQKKNHLGTTHCRKLGGVNFTIFFVKKI